MTRIPGHRSDARRGHEVRDTRWSIRRAAGVSRLVPARTSLRAPLALSALRHARSPALQRRAVPTRGLTSPARRVDEWSNEWRFVRPAVAALFAAIATLPSTPAIAQEAAPAAQPPAIRSLAFSPDGKRLAVAVDTNGAGILAIWSISERKPRLVKREPVGLTAVTFAPSGETLAIGPAARLLDAESGELLKTFEGHAGPARSVAFSTDGKQLVTASGDRTVKLWDVSDASCYATLEGHTDAVMSAALSPDGHTVVSCSNDQTTRVWDAQSGQQKQLLKPADVVVRSVAFSPDGRFFATAHYDAVVRIRETESTKLRARIKTDGRAECALFSSDGRTLAVCTSSPTVDLFDIALGEPPGDLRKKIADLIARWDDDDYTVREAASAELVKIGTALNCN